MAKLLTFIFFFIGISICGYLAWYTGFHTLLSSLASVGVSGIALLAIIHLLMNLALSTAWHQGFRDVPLFHLFKSRLLRDSAATCLPFSQLGGMAVGVKTTHEPKLNIDWVKALGMNIFDITTEVISQVGFIILALSCLLLTKEDNQYFTPILCGVIFLFFGVIGFVWTQKKGGKFIVSFATSLGNRFAKDWSGAFKLHGDHLSDYLRHLWSQLGNILRTVAGHFVCWLSSALITWITLHLLDTNIDATSVVALEGLVCATMSAGFFVPAGLGVQEGAYIGIGHIFGIPAEIGMSLSLLRRARELVIGLPALLFWQGDSIRRIIKN